MFSEDPEPSSSFNVHMLSHFSAFSTVCTKTKTDKALFFCRIYIKSDISGCINVRFWQVLLPTALYPLVIDWVHVLKTAPSIGGDTPSIIDTLYLYSRHQHKQVWFMTFYTKTSYFHKIFIFLSIIIQATKGRHIYYKPLSCHAEHPLKITVRGKTQNRDFSYNSNGFQRVYIINVIHNNIQQVWTFQRIFSFSVFQTSATSKHCQINTKVNLHPVLYSTDNMVYSTRLQTVSETGNACLTVHIYTTFWTLV